MAVFIGAILNEEECVFLNCLNTGTETKQIL